MFTPLVAAVWPVELAAACLDWAERHPATKNRRCDDAQVVKFLASRRAKALAVVPSLVDHDEAEPST
jgi:hypothetical protein